MPGLSRELIEHRLLIKASFIPYKQRARNFKPEIVKRVKEEADRLLQAGFIQPCRYADWVSNIVPCNTLIFTWKQNSRIFLK